MSKNRLAFAFLFVSLLPLVGIAQEDAANLPDAGVAAADDELDSNAGERPFREQTIYIPYDRLKSVFERQGRGVFLPYEKFQELWRKARASETIPQEKKPPVGALIAEIENEAEIQDEVLTVSARVKIEVLRKGWHTIPLRLADAAIREATIDGKAAHLTFDAQQNYELLVNHDSEEAKQIELRLEYTKAFTKSPGQNSVSFQAPQAPINRWRIRIPQAGVKVNVHPLIAATEEPLDDDAEAENKDETVVLAFVGAAPSIQIDWTPKAEGATGLTALATVQAEQEFSIDEGVVRTRTRMAYSISRAELSQLSVQVPGDHKVTGVFDPNVRQWEVTADGDQQTISIQLFEPTRGSQNVTIELEKFINDVTSEVVTVPVVRAMDVGRQQGVLVVRVGEELRADVTQRSGLLQLDAGELPPALANQSWLFAYRYAALPFELAINVEKVQPRIRVDQLVEAYLQPDQVAIELFAVVSVERAGVFQFDVNVPAGYQVLQVSGHAAANATAVAVDSYFRGGDDNTRLRINLSRKALGRNGILVRLRRSLDDPNLTSPTGEASQIELPIPRVATEAEQFQGRLMISAPESLRVNPESVMGARPISFTEAVQGLETTRGGRFANLRSVLAYAYGREPVELDLTAERRRPYVTARQLLTVAVDSGVVRFDATFHYQILYSGVKSLRIDLPEALTGQVRNRTAGIRETTMQPQPEDVAEGYVAWRFEADTELLGNARIHLHWEEKGDELEIGRSDDIQLPVLRPIGVDRAWGQIVVTKGETLDIRASGELAGLRPIDPQHDVMPEGRVADAARAFEFHDDWSLTITATRFELEDVKRTSIERALLRMVVTRSDRVSVQALYRIRSAVQRLPVQLPGDAEFDTDPLRINGVTKALEQGDGDQRFMPLTDRNPDDPFLVELRYTVPGNQSRLDFPVFPSQPPVQDEPAMQIVNLAVYLPRETMFLDSEGPWHVEESDWLSWLDRRREPSDNELLDWVSQGVGVDRNRLNSFPTDGRLYVFSGLQPAAPPDGSLRVRSISERWWNCMIFGFLGVVGLMFVRQRITAKLIVLTLLFVAIVAIGVFLPTFSRQILDSKLMIAVGLIVVVWGVGSFVRLLPRSRSRATQPPIVRATAVPEDSPPPRGSSPPVAPVSAEAGESPFVEEGDQPDSDEQKSEGGESNG